MMKFKLLKLLRIASLVFLLVMISSVLAPVQYRTAAQASDKKQTLVQISTYDYFAAGNYDGFLPISALHTYGDFGLGTFDRIDGEMIAVDGKFYQVRADGKARLADENNLTPFAVVTFWQSATAVPVEAGLTLDKLKAQLDKVAPNPNEFYAIRIDGTFNTLKVRSEESAQKPYPVFTDFIKNQIIFNYSNIKGTLVGFRSPELSKGVQVVGYHFHFISADQKTGGHVLGLITGKAELAVNEIALWEVVLPETAPVASK